jgi:nucleoside-diphosphate-sugar epimerase
MMWRQILVTGATGVLGIPLVRELLRQGCAERIGLLIRPAARGAEERFRDLVGRLDGMGAATRPLFLVEGDLLGSWDREEMCRRDTEVVLHAAADTRFRADDRKQELVNVQGTRRALEWARGCPRLSHAILVSTTCVAGARTGTVAETSAPQPQEFINPYERSKWQAERLATDAGLPIHVVRLSTCVGSRWDGEFAAPGAFHHSLRWLYHGFVPMMPGSRSTRVDFIPTDIAVAFLVQAALQPPVGVEIHHVAAGSRAVGLEDLIEFLVATFRETHAGWRRGQIPRPVLTDAATFAAFRRSVTSSRDALLGQVMESMDAFLPALLYPKIYETKHAERFWGGRLPVPDWRETIERVVRFCLTIDWGRLRRGEHCHAS